MKFEEALKKIEGINEKNINLGFEFDNEKNFNYFSIGSLD